MKTQRKRHRENGGCPAQRVLECGGKRSATPLSTTLVRMAPGVRSLFRFTARGVSAVGWMPAPARWVAPSRLKAALLGGLLTLLVLATCGDAQTYSIDWYKVAGGGGTSTGGVYSVSGTIGQPDAGGPMTGGNYSLTGGFWSLIAVVQTPGAPLLTITYSGNSMTVSWPSPSTGWTLQQNSDLTTTSWSTSGGISDNGTNKSITITSPTGNLFFRLSNP